MAMVHLDYIIIIPDKLPISEIIVTKQVLLVTELITVVEYQRQHAEGICSALQNAQVSDFFTAQFIVAVIIINIVIIAVSVIILVYPPSRHFTSPSPVRFATTVATIIA